MECFYHHSAVTGRKDLSLIIENWKRKEIRFNKNDGGVPIVSDASYSEQNYAETNLYTHTHIYIYIYIYIGFSCCCGKCVELQCRRKRVRTPVELMRLL